MDIKLDEAALTEAVTQAIVNSVLGEKMEKAIRDVVDRELRGGYNSTKIVETVVISEIRNAVQRIITERADDVRRIVAKELTDDKLAETVTNMWRAAAER